MKAIEFEKNDSGMRYEYHRTREGPNWFMCYYKGSAVINTDPKEAWRTLGVAKFTDTGKELKAWCLEMHDTYVINKGKEKEEGRQDTSFASEAVSEVIADREAIAERAVEPDHQDPTANTKMVT